MDFSSAASKVSIFLFQVRTEAQIEQARELFLEYAQSLASAFASKASTKNWLNFLATSLRHGRLLANYEDNIADDCLHPVSSATADVEPTARGCRASILRWTACTSTAVPVEALGRALAERVIAEPREIGYSHMRLEYDCHYNGRCRCATRSACEISTYMENHHPLHGVEV